MTRNKDVPYCDTFGIEADWFIMSKPKTKSCVVRLTVSIKWFKSTMMKTLISSSIESGTKEFWDHYLKWVIEEQKMGFVEKKRTIQENLIKKKKELFSDTRKVDK